MDTLFVNTYGSTLLILRRVRVLMETGYTARTRREVKNVDLSSMRGPGNRQGWGRSILLLGLLY